jgi:starvation-inducible DNA-binding protein
MDMSQAQQELAEKLSELLGSSVVFKFEAQGFHWNVRGPEFYQFHKFFGKIYEDIDSSIDPLAENIRKLGYDAPRTLEDFISLSCIDSKPTSYDPIAMSAALYTNLMLIQAKYDYAFKVAEACNKQGVADFLAGRIDMMDKWAWQLRTTIGADKTQVQSVQIVI